MGLGEDLRALAALVEDLERQGIDVVDATPADSDEEALVADLRIRVTPGDQQPVPSSGAESGLTRPGIEPQAADAPAPTDPPQDDSSAEAADAPQPADTEDAADSAPSTDDVSQTASPDAPGPTDPPDDATADDDAAGADDRVLCTHETCAETFDSEHGMRIHRSKTHVHGGDRDAEELARVYDQHDTFPAMRDALEADVSAQTVRRWMMDAGVHAPDTETGEKADAADGGEPTKSDDTDDAESPAAGTDTDEPTDERDLAPGSASHADLPAVDEALPAGVTAGALSGAVEEASTLYDVQQRLDLDRETARDLLAEYDLLELVHGRVADRPEREELKEEIDDRLQANAEPADSRSD